MGAPWLERYGRAGGTGSCWWALRYASSEHALFNRLFNEFDSFGSIWFILKSFLLRSTTRVWRHQRKRQHRPAAEGLALSLTLHIRGVLGCRFICSPFFSAHATTFHLLGTIRSLPTGKRSMSSCPGADKIVVQIRMFLLCSSGPPIQLVYSFHYANVRNRSNNLRVLWEFLYPVFCGLFLI